MVWSAWFPPIPFFVLSYFWEGTTAITASLQNLSWISAVALIYLAIVSSIVGYSLWGHLLSRYPAAQVVPLTLGVPVVGLSCSALLLDEQVSLLQWGGIALVMVGLWFNMQGERITTKLHQYLPQRRLG